MKSPDLTHLAPGLARLDALAAGVRQAGLPVAVTVTGQPRPLPAVTDLAAFRIIQEALTNSIRHAGPATAAVGVSYGDDCLLVEITDDGRGAAVRSAKNGDVVLYADGSSREPAGRGRARPARCSSGHAAGWRHLRDRAPAERGFRVAAQLPAQIARSSPMIRVVQSPTTRR